jgi:hypothetical protein
MSGRFALLELLLIRGWSVGDLPVTYVNDVPTTKIWEGKLWSRANVFTDKRSVVVDTVIRLWPAIGILRAQIWVLAWLPGSAAIWIFAVQARWLLVAKLWVSIGVFAWQWLFPAFVWIPWCASVPRLFIKWNIDVIARRGRWWQWFTTKVWIRIGDSTGILIPAFIEVIRVAVWIGLWLTALFIVCVRSLAWPGLRWLFVAEVLIGVWFITRQWFIQTVLRILVRPTNPRGHITIVARLCPWHFITINFLKVERMDVAQVKIRTRITDIKKKRRILGNWSGQQRVYT